jgi:hypothetical protein
MEGAHGTGDLSDLIAFMQWSLDAERNTVLTQRMRAALQAHFDAVGGRAASTRSEGEGEEELSDNPWTTPGVPAEYRRWQHYSALLQQYTTEQCTGLLEGAAAQGITVPTALLHALVGLKLSEPDAWDFDLRQATKSDQQATEVTVQARLISAVIRHESGNCKDHMELLHPRLLTWLRSDPHAHACAAKALCKLLELSVVKRQWRTADSTAASMSALAQHSVDGGGLTTEGVCAVRRALSPDASQPHGFSATALNGQQWWDVMGQWSQRPQYQHIGPSFSIIASLLTTSIGTGAAAEAHRDAQLSDLRPILAKLPKPAACVLLSEASDKQVSSRDMAAVSKHIHSGLRSPSDLVTLVVKLDRINLTPALQHRMR